MAAHNRLGKEGEDAVAAYLERKGYTILHRNWRKNRLELDIVATHDGELVVVEVKTRTNTEYKEPQEAVDWRKVRHIVVAAEDCPSAQQFCRLHIRAGPEHLLFWFQRKQVIIFQKN